MTGVDVHADSDIGKHLSALARTLTALTGEEEDDQQVRVFWTESKSRSSFVLICVLGFVSYDITHIIFFNY